MVQLEDVPSRRRGLSDLHLRRARQPVAPGATRESSREDAERQSRRRVQEGQERTRIFRGLLLLAVMILLWSMHHAGWGRVFVPGWWRQW